MFNSRSSVERGTARRQPYLPGKVWLPQSHYPMQRVMEWWKER